MIRIAAAGDLHFDRSSRGRIGRHLKILSNTADVLFLAGDLTQTGHPEEAFVLAEDLMHSPVPVYAVLGNHDFHLDRQDEVREVLEKAGVNVLEQQSSTLFIRNHSVGIVGLKGFGGGFVGACGSDFGEPEMKAFIRHTKAQAKVLGKALSELNTDYRLVLMHYSPISGTLKGEKKEIYPFLGSYLLGEAIDQKGANIIFHGHAHRGVEKGITPGGIPVRNVAQHVIRHVFNIYVLNRDGVFNYLDPMGRGEIFF